MKNRWTVEIAWPEDFGLGTRLTITIDAIAATILSVEAAP